MKLVIVESPFAPKGRYTSLENLPENHSDPPCRLCDYERELKENLRYARLCMRDCLMRGEAPFASHLLYTQEGVLDDTKPEERKLGIEAGLFWSKHAEVTVVYDDMGISDGMRSGIKHAELCGIPVIHRQLPGWSGWKVITIAAQEATKPVPKCNDCMAPALHTEGFHFANRFWCEHHVPMSGHYEYCGEECQKLKDEVSQRLYGKPWPRVEKVVPSPSWPRLFGEPGGHTGKQKEFAVALDAALAGVVEVVNCSLGRNTLGQIWIVTVNEVGNVYSVQCQIEEGTEPYSMQALKQVNRVFRSYLESRKP